MDEKKAIIKHAIKQLQKELYKLDPEELKRRQEYQRLYKKNNPEKIKKIKKRFYKKHPDYNREYYLKHKSVKGQREVKVSDV